MYLLFSSPETLLLLCAAVLMCTFQIAECFESNELLAGTLKHDFGGGSDKKHISFFHVFNFGPDADLTAAFGADENAWSADAFKGSF